MKKLIEKWIIGYPGETFPEFWITRILINYGLINLVIDLYKFIFN